MVKLTNLKVSIPKNHVLVEVIDDTGFLTISNTDIQLGNTKDGLKYSEGEFSTTPEVSKYGKIESKSGTIRSMKGLSIIVSGCWFSKLVLSSSIVSKSLSEFELQLKRISPMIKNLIFNDTIVANV